jgi:hypothetical protein
MGMSDILYRNNRGGFWVCLLSYYNLKLDDNRVMCDTLTCWHYDNVTIIALSILVVYDAFNG